MKKYIQITIVLIFFFVIVLFRRHSSGNSSLQTDGGNLISGSTNGQLGAKSSSTSSGMKSGGGKPMAQAGSYKNGSYDGSVENAYYGDVQIRVTVSGGRISDVTFLQYPNDNNTSRRINTQAMPMLKSEALQAQSAQLDGVSGASYSSQAFADSLNTALQKAS